MAQPELYVFPTPDDISAALNVFVAGKSRDAIARSGRFTIALSGGSLPKVLAKQLKSNKSIDWSKWHVFFADERLVPLDHPDSNYLLAKQELLDHVPIPHEQIYTADPNVDRETAAKKYEEHLKKVFGSQDIPSFDLILLGIGPDGHTCSLFPGHPLLDVKDRWVASLDDSPKPPPTRITFTYPLLNNADTNAFVVTGDGKAETVYKILEKREDFPAGRVKAKHRLIWFTDNGAAKLLTIPASKFSL
ncbi:6-phosphogluconolactonase [Spizellomyces punctatus DAOM BR117]|uniref:6-phosphogluconolactonase n=1 Tax=Spizellomyces punctatus (strain DAOM BR117) TaxID=645134 RepID=A0A0L0HW68_SPIPD|nr:6-phosphogluconolactonase [Spizellomyces punctatus DAOM BR117]KND05119.1 6-phosphogluconolactonase [Spizellomyces punctatus DAOM BR117]|eukprot:XP_016613158.1 6-phosphogluconolactonase [Spizellomyces punctatus DAOM BR117]